MREPLQMYTASRMQDMSRIRDWNVCFTTELRFNLFFPPHRLWVSLTVRTSVFVPHCWFSSFRTPRIRRGLLLLLLLSLSGPLPITDLVLPSSLGAIFTTQRYLFIIISNNK